MLELGTDMVRAGTMGRMSILLALLTIGQQAIADIKPLQPLPPDLQNYFDICHQTGDLTHNPGQLVFWASIQQYVTKFTTRESEMSRREAELLSRTVYEIMEPIMGNQTATRYKATARVRKEIRAMSLAERRNYFNALNAAKNDRRLRPNVYDVLARIHTGGNIAKAHFGPAFPSWHRMYLYIFETILRQWYDATVTIPYWASVLDNEMADSTQSVIWSDGFFGNGYGVVNRGPFSNWPLITPGNTIRRNIGNGNLLSYTGIANILRRTRNADILLPTALPGSNFEIHHGGPHSYVGGTMNNLQRAAFDPIFFSYHAFADEIWERFREGQIAAGINPETDYPYDPNNPSFKRTHAPDATAGFSTVGDTTLFGMRLTALTQRVGYRYRFSQIIRYDPVPRCPDCAMSPYLFCEYGRCVSRTITEMSGTYHVQDLGLASFARQPNNPFTPNAGLTMGKLPPPPAVHQNEGCPKTTLINDVNTNRLGHNSLSPTVNQWAYIPIKVVSKRPPNMRRYEEYNMYDDNMPGHAHNDFTSICKQKGYDNCKNDQDPVGKIKIVSYGLNYDGYAEDYIIVDNRLGVSEGNGFLPVKTPTGSGESEVIVAAFDACGRVCKPYCNLPDCDRLNKDFNGGFSISSKMPKQYYRTLEEATLGVWKPKTTYGPTYDNNVVPVTFFCEYDDTWVWNKYVPPPWSPQASSMKPTQHTYQETVQTPNYVHNNVETLPTYTQRKPDDQSFYPPTYEEQYQAPTQNYLMPNSATPTGSQHIHYGRSEYCQVSTDCLVNVPCRGCVDSETKMCEQGQMIAICIHGQYSATAPVAAPRNQFYQ